MERLLSVFRAKDMHHPIKVYGSLGGVLDFCEKMQLGTEEHQTQGCELRDHFFK